MNDFSKIETIFDSRTAKKTYAGLNYYRSANIFVPPGYVALVELTTGKDHIKNMTFTAIRTPQPTSEFECYENSGCIGKRYRRWKCCQSLGEDIQNTQFDDYNKSVVRWGYDKFTEEIVEFEWITRPGNYYLVALKCNALDIEDCDIPTIFEVSIIPADRAFQLSYPCYKACPDDVEEPQPQPQPLLL